MGAPGARFACERAGERLIEAPHGLTRCEVAGPEAGPGVLLVPGLTYPLEVWDPLFAALAGGGWRAARFDLYGRGGSAWDGAPLDAGALVEQCRAVLDALAVARPVHLISLSNADLLLAALASRAPGEARSLAWIAPSGFDRRTMHPRTRALAARPLLRALWQPLFRRTCRRRMERHLASLAAGAPAGAREVFARSIRAVREGPVFPGAALSHLGHLPRDGEVEASLAGVAAAGLPVLAVRFAGERDATEAGLARFLGRVPGLREAWVDGGGHMGLIERAPEVARIILGFLGAAGPAPRPER